MEKDRLLAFSDGVMAIIVTLMAIELVKVPHDVTVEALREIWPTVLSYILSFIYVAIYWNNHHHLFLTVKRVSGGLLWANMFLLFWLSLVPFATAWMGENHFAALPTAVYGVALLGPAVAYALLEVVIIRVQGQGSLLKKAVRGGAKEVASVVLYAAGIALALLEHPAWGLVAYMAVAALWLVPDKRIERRVAGR